MPAPKRKGPKDKGPKVPVYPHNPGNPGKPHRGFSLMKRLGKSYGFVNQRNGYTAYRSKTNPKDELVFDSDNNIVSTDIITFWSTL